jgi:hypothetical protein
MDDFDSSISQRELIRVVCQMPPGADLDRLVAAILFREKSQECSLEKGTFHMRGAQHPTSKVTGQVICTSRIPPFSSDGQDGRHVLEWLTSNFDSVELVFDSGSWYCNLSRQDNQSRWYRMAHTAGNQNMYTAACKAGLLAVFQPLNEPLRVEIKVNKQPVLGKSLRASKIKGRKRRRRS